MSIEFPCVCGVTMKVRDEYGGSPIRCKKCGEMVKVPRKGEQVKSPEAMDQYGLDADRGGPQTREYKVLTQSDMFLGSFDPVRLQHILNAHAKKGWTVRSIATATVASASNVVGALGISRDEVVVVLERDI